MSDWQPIETAPKDGTKVDLWVIETYMGNINAERRTDCWWGKPSESYDFRNGTTTYPEQWCVVGDHYGDRIDDRVEDEDTKATHWMPLPAPPEAK